MLEKLREQAEAAHKRLIVFPCDDRKPQETLALLNAVNPLGIVMLHESMDDALADAINQRNIPTIVCGGIPIGRRFSSVHIDDMMAAYDGTNYLLELGHSKIGFLTDNSRAISSGFQRLTGCKKAFEDAGLPLPPDWILPTGMTFEDGYQGIDQLLQRQPDLTAVFAFSDDLAVGTLVRLYELGKQVPEHISVLGFDDHIMARATIPPLTTIHQPLEDIARYTIERLINMQGAHDISSVTVAAPFRSVQPVVRLAPACAAEFFRICRSGMFFSKEYAKCRINIGMQSKSSQIGNLGRALRKEALRMAVWLSKIRAETGMICKCSCMQMDSSPRMCSKQIGKTMSLLRRIA